MIGSVSYLNAKPLIHGLPTAGLFLEVPSALSKRFAQGGLEAALLPVFEIFQIPNPFVADGIAIGCLGPVKSVIVASPAAFSEAREISPDPSSVTSNSLLKILLAEFFPGGPRVVTRDDGIPSTAARLIIGDQALAFRKTHPSWHFFDLGESWFQHTGLPFVFAAWCLSPPAGASLANALRQARDHGLAHLPEIANTTANPAEALDYLSQNIRYGLGDPEKTSLDLFASLALRHGLLNELPSLRWI
ncbi:MAG: menaquinone biosynthesis protein [Terrimicrobiaceae bacterium]